MIHRTPQGIELCCDVCGYEIMVFTEEEVLMESPFEAGGWSDYKTAHVHACNVCWDEEIRREWRYDRPCDRCNNQPCEKGRDCWWEPRSHKFPYETYIAQRKSPGYRPKDRWLWLFFEFGPKEEVPV